MEGGVIKRYQKEIVRLTAAHVLGSIADLALPFFEAHSFYRVSARKFREQREFEQVDFAERIKYLRKQGLIENFVEGKEKYFEITSKGVEKLLKYRIDNLSIERPQRWDGKWRIVIFDIPKKHNLDRDILRRELIKLGFVKIQDSVYVYPFDCSKFVENISGRLSIRQFVLIMISEIIQGEEDIIEKFLDSKVLIKSDLKTEKGSN